LAEQPTIWIDADACPVKAETIEVAERHDVPVVLVTNGGLRPYRNPLVRIVVVSKAFDAADDHIAGQVVENDVVITADVPLAKRCVELGAHVVGPTGRLFTVENIGMASAMRDLSQALRESGEIKGYNPSFSKRDRSAFTAALDRVVRQSLRPDAPGKAG